MKKITLLLPALLLATWLPAQKPDKDAAWLRKNTQPLQLQADHFNDLQFLKTLLQNKRVVLLGESSHGMGEYYTLKSRLVEFLYREMSFEVIAMESGIADIYLRWLQTDTLSAAALRNSTVFGNFQCREIMPLFQLIKSTYGTPKPLIYAGFDSQNFMYAHDFLKTVIAHYDTAKAHRIYNDLYKYYNIRNYLWQADKTPLLRLSDTVIDAAKEALKLVTENEAAIKARYGLNAAGMAVMKRGIMNYMQSMQLDWNRDNPSEKRDSLMADNLRWLMDSLYPGKKIIVWAHNGHIGKNGTVGNTNIWMGERLRKQLGAQTYHIGLFAREGRYYEWWTKLEKIFLQNKSRQLEQRLKASGKAIGFLNLEELKLQPANKWLFGPVQAFEVENGGQINFIPTQRFDGLIFLRQVHPPIYQ
jgi:erythromycin esterase